jgi:hypothetical protein
MSAVRGMFPNTQRHYPTKDLHDFPQILQANTSMKIKTRHHHASPHSFRLMNQQSFISWGGVRLSPLGTSATVWPIVPAPINRWWWMWSSRWNENWQGKPKYSEKTCPSATLSTTNPTWPDLARTRAAAVGSRRLTAWAMARPSHQSY